MGKKQHQKDKLYLTTTEWKEQYGGHKDHRVRDATLAKLKRLPFAHCCISLRPCDIPYCAPDGYVFDLVHILKYLKKFGKHPVTAEKLDAKNLIKLVFFKSPADEYWCPITRKVFSNNSHVVAIRTTGHVFSYEAVEELNLKSRHFKDLVNDEPFTRKDVIVLQDPYDLEKFDISKFDHVKNNLKTEDDQADDSDSLPASHPLYRLKNINPETRNTLSQLEKDYKPTTTEDDKPQTSKADSINAAHYSTGMVAAGFTSTVMEPVTEQRAAIIDEDTLKYKRVKGKGYVRLITNKGHLNLELYCDQVPRTCDNFIQLCKRGYYKGTIFHRLIRNFMVQGGDPTGTGGGGESAWGKPFADEIVSTLSHSGRGVLSMANRGSNTNTSQFYITFRSCKHLDKKHTIFGRLVGGLETLDAIEAVETDEKDKPITDIGIVETVVFVDPFEKAVEQLAQERTAAREREEALCAANTETKTDTPTVYRSGVGKYINVGSVKKAASKEEKDTDEEQRRLSKKRKAVAANFTNFSDW